MKKILTLLFALIAFIFCAKAQTFLSESFESGTLPAGWTIIDSDGDGFNWQPEIAPFTTHSGNGCIVSASYDNATNTALTPDNWLITPAINLTSDAILSFWVVGQDPNWAAENYSVYVATGNTVADFTATTPLITAVSTGVWEQKTIDLSNYTGQTVYIAFRHYNVTDMYYLNFDDISVFATPVNPWTSTFDGALENTVWDIDNNGANNTNKWYIGQAQGFDNNKLFISSNNGVTNKYDVTVSSVVKASRNILIPATGAILSFDYRVNGKANYDYLQVDIVKDANSIQLAKLSGTNDWTNATYNIPPELAGYANLVFTWVNTGIDGEQFPAAIDNVTMIETPCVQPAALQVLVDGTNANVSWTGNADAYLLQYKLADHSEWYTINTTETSVVLNNLQGNSIYNVRVQSVCNDMASVWTNANFSVDCQNFEIDSQRGYLVVGSEENEIELEYMPFYGYYNYTYSQQIVDASEINATSGTIYSISFKSSNAPSSSSTGGIRIWMGNTDKSTFSNTADYIDPSQLTEVYVGPEFYAYQTGWNEFVLNTPFEYTGGNLVIAYYEGNGDYDINVGAFYVNGASGNKSLLHFSDNDYEVSYTDPASKAGISAFINCRNVMKFDINKENVICYDVEACPVITNLTVSNVGASTADVAWTAGNEDETNFIVEYKTAEDADWTSVEVNGATTYTLTDLSQISNYQVRVRANCGTNNLSEPVTATFTTLSSCAFVTNLSVSNNSNTTTLTWTPGSTETNWLVEFKPVTAGDDEWISINADILPTITFGGLLSMTEYVVRVKALCDPNDEANQSVWTEYAFTSGCAAVDAPFAEAFDSYSMPSCWDANGFSFSGDYTYSNDQDAWIMTPSINIPSDETTYISFDVRGDGDFKILASYRGTAENRFAEIYSGTVSSSSNYTQVVVPIPANLKGRQVYFKIVNEAGQDQYIDNLSIDYCPVIPANLTVSNITDNTATLSWTAQGVSNFQVKVGEDFYDVTGANTYTLTGLTGSTDYTVAVRAKCSEDNFGVWSSEVEFRTICSVVTLPYSEDFETTDSYEFPECWTIVSSDINNTPYVYSYSNYSYFTTQFLGLNYAAIVATPKIAAPANMLMLKFDFTQENINHYSCGPIEVGFTTNLEDIDNITWLATINNSTNKAVENKTIYFNTLNTEEQGYVVFRGMSSNYLLAIDNLLIDSIPTCGTPTIAVAGTTATITPSDFGTPVSYDLQIGNEIQTVTTTTVDLASIFALESNSTYEVSVRANCSADDQSEWSQPVSFETPCAAVALPLFESFESSTCPADCWTIIYGSGTPSTNTMIHTTDQHSVGQKSFRFSSYSNASDYNQYLITPELANHGELMLSFDYKRSNDSEQFRVGYSTTTNDIRAFTWGSYITNATANWQEYTQTLPSDVKYIAINYNSNYSYYLYIDNLNIMAAPTCGTPSIAVNGTTATITRSTIGTPESYDLQIGNEIQTVTETTVDLTSIFTLAPQTTYSVSVRANCGEGDQSEWSQAVSFVTPCLALELPYVQDFEGTAFPPECWSQEYVSGTHNWTRTSNTSYGVGTYNATFAHTSSGTSTKLITPAFNLASLTAVQLTFKHRQVDWSGDQDVLIVYYRPSTSASWVTLAEYTNNVPAMTLETIILPADALTATCQFAFEGYDNYGHGVFVDDIRVEKAPTCGTPTIAVVGTTATIAPNAIGTPVSYDLQIGNEIQTVTTTTADLTDVFDLDLNTTYEVSVRANCGEGDYSEWSQPVAFTTPACYSPCVYTIEMTDAYGDGWTGNAISVYVDNNIQGSYTISSGVTNNVTISNCEQGELSFKWSTGQWPEECSFIIKDAAGQTLYSCTNGSSLTTGQVLYSAYCGEIPTCGTPTIAVVGTTATITPSDFGTPVSYDLQIGNEIQTVTTTTADLTDVFDLDFNTTYEVSVRANCGDGDYSEWSQPVSFETPCMAFTSPYFEGFENGYTNGAAVAGCISQQSVSGSYSWTANSSETDRNRTPRTGSWNAYLHWSDSQWMFIPMHFEANRTYVFEMYARQDQTSGCSMKVAYGTSNTSSAMTNTIVNTTSIGSSFVHLTGTFTPTTTGDYYVGIYGELNSTPYYVSIDDISIIEVPSCGTPTIAVDGTTATITPSETGTAESYDIQINNEIQTVTDLTFDIEDVFTNLTHSTAYQIVVRANCGDGDISNWSQPVTFTTTCGPVAIPYFQDFDSYTSSYDISLSTMPTCWERFYTGTIGGLGAGIFPSTSYSGNNSLRFYLYGDSPESTSFGNAYAILPEMDADLNVLGMELYARNSSSYDSEFEVGVVTDVNDPENTFILIKTIDPTSTNYAKYEVSFADYMGANGNIALRMLKPNNAFKYAYIDNITVKQIVFAKDIAVNSIDPIVYSCDQSNAQVTLHIVNKGLVDTVTSFVANYQIDNQDIVSETVNCNLVPGATMDYTFNTLPVIGTSNTIRAYITLDGDMNEENNIADPIYTGLIVPETVPYIANLNNVVVNRGWNVLDANEDKVTMDIYNGAIVYDFNDEAAADDWMFTPCFELAAGSYNVYYDYKANSSLNERFELFFGNDNKVAAMTYAVANHDFNNTDYETAMQTITVTEDGTYNFGFHATSLAGNLGFSIENFKIYPINDVVVTSNANGTVTPNGVVSVNYGDDLSINIVPNPMYHVSGIYVDGVQVVNEDPYGSNFMLYTLENVTAPHTIYVDYKLEFHIIKNAVNARPDLYTENGGYFIPAATDTLIDPSAVTVTFAPEAHYHFADLVLGIRNMDDPINVTDDVVNNGNGTYSYTIDTLVVSNYYVQATFRKDTINVHYNILAGNGYVDASDLLAAPASYDTWIDYGTDHTASIVPANGYYLIDVNGAGPVADYQINNVTAQADVNVKFGFLVTAEINNQLPSYFGTSTVRGTIAPDTTYIIGGESLTLNGTVENLFHLSSFLIDGVENIQDVNINNDGTYSYTFAEVMDNHHVNAIVAIDTVGVHYTVEGNGIVDNHAVETSATFDHYVDYGTTFNAMFVPAIGYHVAGVTINGVFYGNIDEWQFANLTGEQYVTVVFEKNVYTITTAGYGQGTVSDGETFEYDPEHTYTFTATPAAGYHIESILRNNVELNIADPEATYTETLTNILSDYNYNVVFNPSQYTVTATAGANGLITPAGVTSYYYNNQAVYNVTADLGYYINTLTIDGVSVTLDPATTTASHTFTFTGENAHNHTINATFARLQYTVTVDAGAHGTITPGTATYNYGATPTYTIAPEAGYGIADVTVDGHSVGAVSSYTFTSLTDNHTIAATFVQYEYTIQASAGNGGTITPSGLINAVRGGTQNFTITPATGYHIAAIYVDGEATAVANQYTFASIDANHTIHAMFEANTYTVTVNQPNNGVITPGTMTVAYGATPTYVVTPNTGYNVTAITVNGTNVISSAVNTNGVYSYTMAPVTADATVTATMTQRTFTINATAGAHGTINGPSTVNYGANATYTITPAAGYVVDNVTVDGMAAGAITSYTFTNVVANHTINATFRTEDCDVPTNMHTVDVTTSTATFMWYHPTATAFEIQYKAVDAAAYTTVNVNAMSYDVIDLTPSTSYVWMVRANCGNGNYSEWSNGNIFRTLDVPDIHDGIEDYNVKEMVNVYASHSNVYIVNEGNVQIDNVQIFDIYGKMVYNGKVSSNNEVISMNVATGAYMVRLTTDKGMATYKVVLTK